MGYYRREGRYNITDYTPDNNEDTLYINASWVNINFEDIIEEAKQYFGTTNLSDLTITSEYIHNRCIYYDMYDPNDYDNYIVIRKKVKS